MKKLISLLLVAFTMVCFSGCFDLTGIEDQGNGSANTETSSKSNLGDYNVVIKSCRLAEDYEGKAIVIVKYQFTNNDNDATSFMWSIDENVYQNGVGLNECYFASDSANYSSDNQTKEIRKGVTLDVEVAYELNDTTTDIEVECSELISFSEKKISKTFSIK